MALVADPNNIFNLDDAIQLTNYMNIAYCLYTVGWIFGKEVLKSYIHRQKTNFL